ncbi:bifunctional 3,4-dihydroxy-2-butanone-4-phosphate synthase/GTP cyclohydrolase II [Lentilactobacillus farraginis]|uniref:GTP cyclohydrolase-2 n=1 Tax=Lentilactobacillus farraginis DSM 18382 = JCM 14108 TaxID=1423743 RepID=X0P9K6_9LACO|nr:bifunctional 3,4-dihydroxy-2-butanone-4-phosphate synthase/GTP cyclohydrolase II [Lentilactobacillus farraginis]KRM07403.1 GTP cyclohydrolase II [Lentilactobacillus farraginis DSM 18382 = JCM 14108]GAF35528.1 3,4-dihydroxy-2-butanone 4-phosphate synthase [Lentilactobacillus farraginis DSM 18382 = JCM 14108]
MNKSKQIIKRVERAIAALKQGKLVIVADSLQREAEGDMIGLADFVSPQTVNTMVSKAHGLLCVPMSQSYADRLGLGPMVTNATDAYGTAFTVSTDAKTTSTGISAFDRADTIRQLADVSKTSADFYHPGHIFPLIAADRGTLQRQGHTEAAVDLAKLAGASPVAYICEILKKDGTMARRSYLKSFAEGLQMPFLTIADIQAYRYMKDIDVAQPITRVKLPTEYGDFNLTAFRTDEHSEPTLLISKGTIDANEPLLLRVHSECLTGDVFGSKRCDCGQQLAKSLRLIQMKGHGAVLYLRQEGRGIGLANKLQAYKLQEQGYDTVDANIHLGFEPDQRHYGVAVAILHKLGVHRVDLMTNNPDKMQQLTDLGIDINKRIPLEIEPTTEDTSYLKTKKEKFHHLLKGVE